MAGNRTRVREEVGWVRMHEMPAHDDTHDGDDSDQEQRGEREEPVGLAWKDNAVKFRV